MNGRVVKGINFVQIKDAGDPVELAKVYNAEGADELVFLDITASHENRSTIIEVVKRVAEEVFIPFTVGGGIFDIDAIRRILSAGADKVSLNTAAVNNPNLVKESSEKFGNQCIVVAIDAKFNPSSKKWEVFTHGGRNQTGIDAVEWAKKAAQLGAGEILLTSMDRDGTRLGYDLDLTKAVSNAVGIPVIASGGAGTLDHICNVFSIANADAALLASLLHFGELRIKEIKEHLEKNNIIVRKISEHEYQ